MLNDRFNQGAKERRGAFGAFRDRIVGAKNKFFKGINNLWGRVVNRYLELREEIKTGDIANSEEVIASYGKQKKADIEREILPQVEELRTLQREIELEYEEKLKPLESRKKLIEAQVANIQIEHSASKLNIIIETARPGLIIGRGGGGVEMLKAEIEKVMRKNNAKRPASRPKGYPASAGREICCIIAIGLFDQVLNCDIKGFRDFAHHKNRWFFNDTRFNLSECCIGNVCLTSKIVLRKT